MAQLPVSVNDQKPHAICIPFPAQGHINPMLKLAKILHFNDFHITFVNTVYNHNRLLRSLGPNAFNGGKSFRFESIPDGLPLSEAEATQDIPSLCITSERHILGPFKELVCKLNEDVGAPRVSCIVSDCLMFCTIDLAKELGVPNVLLWTASTCGFLSYTHYEKLVDMGIIPFKDANFETNGDLDRVLDWTQGSEKLRLRDLPTFIRTTDPNDVMLNYVQRLIRRTKRASAILFCSYDALEHDALKSLSSDFPPLYNVGPLQLLLEPIEANSIKGIKLLSTNLWKEDPHCLEWLDSHEPDSVLYVNFGSITVITNDEFVEFAWGLANSNVPFMWIIRPDLISGDSAMLPPDFSEKVKGRGLIVNWCNQEKVLAHSAVGGFLTHCGWNSTLESIISGVPMICWPFFAEQQTNCWYCCNKWGIGMEIDSNVTRGVIENQVKELMEGEKGMVMKKNVRELKVLAQGATSAPCGSSYVDMENVLKLLRSQK